LLFDDVVDVVLADGMIFWEYGRRRLGPAVAARKLRFVPAFTVTPYSMVFRRAEDRDAFNERLRHLRTSGALENINDVYLARYGLPYRLPVADPEGG
jgi:hypothetical protein